MEDARTQGRIDRSRARIGRFSPGGYHLMFTHLTHPLTKGEGLKATFDFEHAGSVPVVFPVMGIGARGPNR